jgi:hypothetical protein
MVCALLSLALTGTIVGTRAALVASYPSSLSTSPLAAALLRTILFPAAIGTATLSIAMWYFWINFDRSSWLRKTVWFLPLYLLFGIGPALYYFLVYRRQLSAELPRPQ